MLLSLDIQNYALISALALDFETGLSVVTGETGAGKSILIEALGLTLGERAEGAVVGSHGPECSVTATYQITDHPRARTWLGAHALGEEDLCTLRRVLYRDGRPSRAFVNDRPVAVQTLRELGDCLIDLHGQHEHQSLTRRAAQLELLDAAGDLETTAGNVSVLFGIWQKAQDELARFEQEVATSEEIRNLNRERLESLRALGPQPGEFEELVQTQRRIDHLERIRQGLTAIREILHHPDATSCESLLRRAEREIRALIPLDPLLGPLATTLDDTLSRLGTCLEALDRYEASQELDPDAMARITERFDGYQSLAYRYRLRPETLHEEYARLSALADTFEGGTEALERLRREVVEHEQRFLEAARHLSEDRRAAADRLAQAVNALLSDFGMAGARFRIVFEPGAASAHGLESVAFEFASHSEQEARPLGKVASGGELSRIALAIQLSSANAQWIPTLIFDEVDTGIGGRVAELVGQKLRTLGQSRQVLCITHLPQVACQGHHHFKVVKLSKDGVPETRVEALEGPLREEELARMLAGSVITETARQHARDMLTQAARTGPARKRAKR